MKRTASIITAVLLFSISLFTSLPAQAHDEVVSVQPEAGSSVSAGVIDLNITFNEDVLATDGATGFDVVVANAAGESQKVGCISPLGNSLSARVAIGKAGDYTVSWHSVSNDGHPAEGTYQFKVTGSESVDATEIENCPRLLIAPAPEDPSAIAYATVAVANDNTGIEIAVLVAVVALVLFFAIWVTTKRKRAKN